MAGLLQVVKDVLRSPFAQKIDFHLGLINVDAAGLTEIHNLISLDPKVSRKIQLAVSGNVLNAATEAAYVYKINTLVFPRQNYGQTSLQRASIVHECVHALHDFYGGGSYYPLRGGSSNTTRSENEAAGYVAGSLYHLYETGKPMTGGPIFDIAGVIARRIMNQPGAFVSTAESTALRIAIISHDRKNDPDHAYDYDAPTIADGP